VSRSGRPGLNIKRAAKRTAIATGFFRPAEWLYRTFVRPELSVQLRREMEFYGQLLRPGDLCFDVGAHIGTKAEALLRTGASVVAFEPQEDCLRELVARCGTFPRFIAVRSAVGRERGARTLYIRKRRSHSSLREDWHGEAVATAAVPVTTLDEQIQTHGTPRYCKIDVEGYSLEVLQGLSQPVEIISFEYHGDEFDRAVACLDHLERLGSLSLNVTPAERPCFASVHRLTKDDFLRFYASDLSGRHEYRYGDVFVFMSQTPARRDARWKDEGS
jgi:FkbM family methyltransferase